MYRTVGFNAIDAHSDSEFSERHLFAVCFNTCLEEEEVALQARPPMLKTLCVPIDPLVPSVCKVH